MRFAALMLLFFSCVGCFTAGPTDADALKPAPMAAKAPPVRADQVTAQNGHQMAQALMEELDRESQERLLNPR